MKSLVMGHKFMAQFVSFVDIIQHREVVSAVRYPVLLILVLTRPSMHTFVSSANKYTKAIIYSSLHYTVNFAADHNQPHVLTSSSDSNTAGETYTLMCSSTLNINSRPLPDNIPPPTFKWSFGPSGNDPLPSGVTDMGTTSGDNITFTSTLQISSLSQCHIGMYTCRLGPARLMKSEMVTVNGTAVYVHDFVVDIDSSFFYQNFKPLVSQSRSLLVE